MTKSPIPKKVVQKPTVKEVEKKLLGTKSALKGRFYEGKVQNYFIGKGWHITGTNVHLYGCEYDVLGKRGDSWSGIDYLVVECKDTGKVSAAYIAKFVDRIDKFKSRHSEGDISAFLCYTGELDPFVQTIAKKNRPPIKLKKVP